MGQEWGKGHPCAINCCSKSLISLAARGQLVDVGQSDVLSLVGKAMMGC